MSRLKRNRISFALAVVILTALPTSLRAQATLQKSPSANGMTTQKQLDFLAAPLSPSAAKPGPPPPFAGWTDEQKDQFPRHVTARCTALWAMMNPTVPPNILPPGMDPAEGSRMALEVCVASHLPRDWPPHAAAIADIQRIMRRSTELGQPLTLPAPLVR